MMDFDEAVGCVTLLFIALIALAASAGVIGLGVAWGISWAGL